MGIPKENAFSQEGIKELVAGYLDALTDRGKKIIETEKTKIH